MATIQDVKYIESLKKKIEEKNRRIKQLENQKVLTAECSKDLLQDLQISLLELQDKIRRYAILEPDGSTRIPIETIQQLINDLDLESVRDRCILTLRNHHVLSWISKSGSK